MIAKIDDRDEARDRAQELAYEAMEAYYGGEEERAAGLCRQALAVYPDCVDAICILAEIEAVFVRDVVEGLRRAVEAGRRDLGEEFFREFKGHFWSLIETRPFMRAMGLLAEIMAEDEYHLDEAIALHEEILELNPGDNQGIRYGLLGCYLARKQYYKSERLLETYKEEESTFFLWGRVLLDFATEGEAVALKTLKKARKVNRFVEKYFFPRKQKPKGYIGGYEPGEESEAIVCAKLLSVAWKMHSPARKWLKQVCEG